MSTDDLRAFIEARLAEDEEGARNALSAHWRPDGVNSCQVFSMADDFSTRTIAWCKNGHDDDFANALHIARHDPARVLREVAAKRAILTAVDKYLDPHPGQPCTNEDNPYVDCELHSSATGRVSPDVLPLLASVWSDHPDYRPSWSTT
jgi:Family of unknown function (DUF6221)